MRLKKEKKKTQGEDVFELCGSLCGCCFDLDLRIHPSCAFDILKLVAGERQMLKLERGKSDRLLSPSIRKQGDSDLRSK